jgi:hypothetical protein
MYVERQNKVGCYAGQRDLRQPDKNIRHSIIAVRHSMQVWR